MTATTPAARPGMLQRIVTGIDAIGDRFTEPITGRRVPGSIVVALVAGLASLAASTYFVPNQFALAYAEALTHLTTARQILEDPSRAGLTGFPLPILLLVPLVAATPLWQSGWAGAVLGATCLAATAAAMYRVAARWGLHGLGRLTAVAAVVANPTMLYLSSTALTEPVLMAALACCLAGLSSWATAERPLRPAELVLYAGVPAAVAALCRQEGWALVAVATCWVAVVAWRREPAVRPVVQAVVAFAALPLAAIGAWLVVAGRRWGDPLGFPPGPGSAVARVALVDPSESTIGHLALSFSTLNVAVLNTVGLGLVLLALFGFGVIVAANPARGFPGFIALTVSTYGFLALALFTGKAVMLNHVTSSGVFNNRYGISCILSAALVAACGVDFAARSLEHLRPRPALAGQVAVGVIAGAALVGQALWLAPAAAGRSLVLYEAAAAVYHNAGQRSAALWLGDNYDGGRVLLDDRVPRNTVLPLAGLPLREYVLGSDGAPFDAAIADPAGHVRWVWATTDPDDRVTHALASDARLRAAYRQTLVGNGVILYVRKAG